MAVTGKFLADFTSFSDAVQKADVELRGMEAGAGRVEKSLNRMVDNFSGRKLIQDATLSAEAIERIGGTSKLTEAELTRVTSQASEAAAKLRAMGQDVPPGIAKIAAEAKSAGGALEGIKAAAGTVAGALGIGLSVGAVVSFGKSVFDAASNVHDMAEKLGISAEATQGFKFAAEQAGSSLDAVGTAITKMNKNLAGSDKATVEVLAKAGLNFADIRAQKPEDAFLAIADAIQKIPDPMVQTQVALTVFGKSAADLLPAIKEGFRATADSADKMSNSTVNDLEAAQDAWGKLADKVTIYSGKVIAETLRVMNVWQRMKEDGAGFGFGDVQAPTVKAPALAINLPIAQLHDTDEAIRLMNEGFDEQYAAAKKAVEAINQHSAAIKALRDQLSGQGAIKAANDMLEALRGTVPVAHMTVEAQNTINKALGSALDAYRALGRTAPEEMRRVWIETMRGPAIISGIAGDLKDLGAQVAIVTPKVQAFGVAITDGLPKDTFKILGDSIKPIPPEIQKTTDTLGELSQAFAQMAQIGGDSFSGAVRGLGQLVASINTAQKAMAALGSNEGGGGVSQTSKITSALSMYIGVGIAAYQVGKSIYKAMNDGRKSIEDFAQSFGGFDALRKQMQVLGAAGEEMWIKLTQQTGRGDKRSAELIEQQIRDAIGSAPGTAAAGAGFKTKAELQDIADKAIAVYGYVRESGQYSASAVAKAFEDAKDAQLAAWDQVAGGTSDAQKAVQEFQGQIDSLSKSIANEAPEEVMGVIEQQTRAQIDAITKQKDAAQLALDDTVGDAKTTAEDAAKAIEVVLASHDFRVKVHLDVDGLPTGASIPADTKLPGFAKGTDGYQNFGSGTAVMLHGWEKVTPRGKANAEGGGGTVVVKAQTFLNRKQIAESFAEAVL